MNWLLKLLGYVSVEERTGISLDKSCCWQTPLLVDWEAAIEDGHEEQCWEVLENFLRSLVILTPPDSVLFIECFPRPDPEMRYFLEENTAKNITKVQLLSRWRPKCYHMQVTEENLNRLAELANSNPLSPIVTNFLVYKDNKVLVEWDGSFMGKAYITKEISEEKVKIFCDNFGTQYHDYDETKDSLDKVTWISKKKKTTLNVLAIIVILCVFVFLVHELTFWGAFAFLFSSFLLVFVILIALGNLMGESSNKHNLSDPFAESKRSPKHSVLSLRKIAKIISSFLMIFGACGFLGSCIFWAVAMSEKPWVSTWIRFPLGDVNDIVVDDKGQIYCAILGNQRIQVYSKEGEFLRGWFARSRGGRFDLLWDSDGFLHVVGYRHYVFNKKGVLLDEVEINSSQETAMNKNIISSEPKDKSGCVYKIRNRHVLPKIVQISPEGNETVKVSDPLFIWPVQGPFQGWLTMMLGFVGVIYLSKKQNRVRPTKNMD
jgi:hypothetical protein